MTEVSNIFVDACKNGDIKKVKLLLKYIKYNHLDIHEGEEKAFCVACEYGQTPIVKLLLNYCRKINSSINIHANYNLGLRQICFNGHSDTLIYLLNNECTFEHIKFKIYILFRCALFYCNIDIIKIFINYFEKYNDKIDTYIYDSTLFEHKSDFNCSNISNLLMYYGKHNYYNWKNTCYDYRLVCCGHSIEYDLYNYSKICNFTSIFNIKHISGNNHHKLIYNNNIVHSSSKKSNIYDMNYIILLY